MLGGVVRHLSKAARLQEPHTEDEGENRKKPHQGSGEVHMASMS
jgi:hypothetical protein